MNKSQILFGTFIVLALVSVYIFLYYAGSSLPGGAATWNGINADLLPLWPYFMALAFGLLVFGMLVRRR
jgi:hypothetical protein